MAAEHHTVDKALIEASIDKLIDNLININDETGEFLLTLEDGRVIDTKGWKGWEWTHGIGLFGLWQLYDLTGSKKAFNIMTKWFDDRFNEGTTTKNINTVAPFWTLANLYEANGNHTYIPYLKVWAEWLMDGLPRTEENGFQHIVYNDDNYQEMWDDTLMMAVLPLAKIGKLLGRDDYIEEAKKQFLIHIKYLFDRKTGLWYHGWTFEGRHNFAEALWARGNCWITIAIPEILELLDLPTDDAFRVFLIETLEAQVKTLAETQDEKSGLWHTLIMDKSSYLEASATAGFAYGILKAVRNRYISEEYLTTGIKAIEGILDNIDEDGELKQVSFGTAMGDDLQFYKDIALTSMPYGQSLAICAMAEFLRTYI